MNYVNPRSFECGRHDQSAHLDSCHGTLQAGSYAKKGLHDMETIIGHAAAMGSKLQVGVDTQPSISLQTTGRC